MWQDQGSVCAKADLNIQVVLQIRLCLLMGLFILIAFLPLWIKNPTESTRILPFHQLISRRRRMGETHTFSSCRDGEAFRPTWKRSRVLDEEFGELPSEAGSYLTDGVSQIVCRIRPVAALQAFYHSTTGKRSGSLPVVLLILSVLACAMNFCPFIRFKFKFGSMSYKVFFATHNNSK